MTRTACKIKLYHGKIHASGLRVYNLRPYQVEAVRAVLESTETSVAVALATGLGKTLLSKEIIRRYHEKGARVVFVVPSIELMVQTGGVMETDNFLGDGMVPDWTKNTLISTVQSLASYVSRLSTYAFNVLIIDEAHHAVAASYLKVIGCQKWDKIVHLSATMFRKDGKKLGEVVDRVVFERDLHWSISEGYLSPYRLIRPKNADVLPCTTETVLIRRIDGQEKTIVRRSFDHAARNIVVRDLVESMFESENRKCAIMFCNTVAHAQKMAELLGDSWGWCSGEYRDDLQKFKRGELRGIVSVQLILEGFDHPPVDVLIINGNIQANTTGAIRWIQLLGRALRLSEGKEYALALDLSACGLPDISYQSDLGGDGAAAQDEEEIEEIDIESLEIIERLEHPMLLTLADLLGGLRQVNNEYRRLKKELNTEMDLLQRGDIYTVVGTSWRLWR
ncbi:MAG: DEAD/DEAH box helicase, partial [Erysipelotrichales bacterium]